MANEDNVVACVAQCALYDFGVVAERRVRVVAGEVHRYHPMPSSFEVRRYEIPAPRPHAGAVNERVRAHLAQS